MAEVVEKEKKEPLFSKKNLQVIKDPLDDNNPVTVQVLGICSALAVTVQVKPALIMSLGVIFVSAFSNLIVSMLRKSIPTRVRIIVQLIVVATLVTIVDQVLKAYMFDVSKKLSVFVGLIITNCIIMGRLEAFALGQKPWPAFLDGVGNGIGYGIILVAVAFFRELFGAGSVLGFKVIPQWFYDHGYVNNGLMVLPPAALFLIGIYIWVQRSRNQKLVNVS
ncbi:NADH:ubiquinone reductase (Na(+)-transporting) subunit D [Jiulongibacter sediminis]|uniref:Na(+)-translocating NADH-quinone reductase subunit D n=1 Tax=Jiulongibacter sediminis TaxID=1605367 RepID=A0A0P7C8L6_9BACT|nr:NADH:ubiquinone reductase (Na(+)-transporting) subunit D [Jiulongibacter sediminis]KPM48870.1 Na(+)-translocating NADH-quinone reductase subunit D [Jiulongibacter sediminis]TBX25400.1 Na(+)-translocating NADH-quinone reductase subunit D [Jiulongibacter sediminis]